MSLTIDQGIPSPTPAKDSVSLLKVFNICKQVLPKMQILVYLEREWDKQQFWQEKRLDAGNLVDDPKNCGVPLSHPAASCFFEPAEIDENSRAKGSFLFT